MKMKLIMTRQNLAEKNHESIKKEVTGEVQPLPDEARRIAVVIQKILKQKEVNENGNQYS